MLFFYQLASRMSAQNWAHNDMVYNEFMKQSRFIKGIGAVVAIGVMCFVYAICIETGWVRVHEKELCLSDWPEELDGLRIGVLSDLHVGSPNMDIEKMKWVVEQMNETSADVVVLLGDYVIHGVKGGTFVTPEEMAPHLGQLKAKHGVFAVLGNHDVWYDAGRVETSFEKAGIQVLDDESVQIANDRKPFWLSGISDFTTMPHDVEKTLSNVNDNEAVVALTHDPDVFPKIPKQVRLTMAGHTHGGQVRLPLLGSLVTPSQYGQRFARGHIQEEGRDLFVTSGLGTSIFPIRFGVRPEIVVLSLHSPKSKVCAGLAQN